MTAEAVFAAALGAQWTGRDSAEYATRRRVFNGAIDRRPLGLAECRSTRDVLTTLDVAAAHGVSVTVRGCGHNIAGRGVLDDVVTIDLAGLRGVRVNPQTRVAVVGGGAAWGHLDACTHRYGLAAPGGTVSSTGVAGLTLGGGIGWLLPQQGLACDNLRAAVVVSTDGTVIRAEDESEPELMSVLRGGGHGLGVVLEFVFDLCEVDLLLGGALVFGARDAAEVLYRFMDEIDLVPKELMISPCLRWAAGEPVLEIDLACTDSKPARQFLDRLGSGAAPLHNSVRLRPYPEMQAFLDNPAREHQPAYWRSAFIDRLDRDRVDVLVEALRVSPTRDCMIMIEHYHGSYATPRRESVFPHRTRSLNLLVVANWAGDSPRDPAGRCVTWARETIAAVAHANLGRYVNYVADGADLQAGEDDATERVRRRLDPLGLCAALSSTPTAALP